ncbi:MAG: tRNA pseudouridine(13) synthase TruD [Thermoplasmata archaeon]
MEEILGIEASLTEAPGIGGKLRIRPEDFIVEEVSIPLTKAKDGRYTVAKIRARNWETNRLVRILARTLRISRRRIRFAGTKDKRAVTTQLVQFDSPPEMLGNLNIKDIEILDVFQTDKRIDLGNLLGNRFRVRIGNIKLSRSETLERVSRITHSIIEIGGFPNFFGVQRFGAARPITHVIGRKICRDDFEGAVLSYLGHPFPTESDDVQEARRLLDNSHDFSGALKAFPKNLSFERAILNHLVKNPEDFVGAILSLPPNLQMMFVHAYQSYLFNKILSKRLRRSLPLHEPILGDLILPAKNDGLPDRRRPVLVNEGNITKAARRVQEGKAFVSGLILGTNPHYADGEMGEIETSVIEREGVKPQDFLVPKIPRISSKGSRREILGPLKDFEFYVGEDFVKASFELIPGSYATSLLREFMKTDMMSY